MVVLRRLNRLVIRNLSAFPLPVMVNGNAGLITVTDGRPMAVMSFTIMSGKVIAIDILADPARLRQLDIDVLSEE